MFWIDNYYFVTKDRESWVLTYEREGKINPATGKPKITKKQYFSSSFKGCLVIYAKEVHKPLPDIDRIIARMDKTDALLTTIEAKAVEEIMNLYQDEKKEAAKMKKLLSDIISKMTPDEFGDNEDLYEKAVKYVGE